MSEEDKKFLWSLIPTWAKESEKGMDPTFYGTLSYEGDLKVIERVKNILNIKKDGDS